jgi:hypothetical protein
MTSTAVDRPANSSPDDENGPVVPEQIEVRAHGPVPDNDVARARAGLAAAIAGAPVRVRSARVDLVDARADGTDGTDSADGDGGATATAQARLDVDGRTVHAVAPAATLAAAIDAVCDRMRSQLTHFDEEPVRTRPMHGLRGVWRHGDAPGERPAYAYRPAADRTIVRTKTYDPAPVSVEEAVRAASLLDVDFFLFTNATTGNDAVVRRVDGNTWALVEAHRSHIADARAAADVAMRCTVTEATELLNVSNARFVFFIEPQVRRLHALYRRYDGNYALITPASPTA